MNFLIRPKFLHDKMGLDKCVFVARNLFEMPLVRITPMASNVTEVMIIRVYFSV